MSNDATVATGCTDSGICCHGAGSRNEEIEEGRRRTQRGVQSRLRAADREGRRPDQGDVVHLPRRRSHHRTAGSRRTRSTSAATMILFHHRPCGIVTARVHNRVKFAPKCFQVFLLCWFVIGHTYANIYILYIAMFSAVSASRMGVARIFRGWVHGRGRIPRNNA